MNLVPAIVRRYGKGTDSDATGGPDDNSAQAVHLVAHTLRAEGFDASEGGTGRGTPLTTTGFHMTQEPITENDGTPALGSSAYLGVSQASLVRRLTPVECERLQGWPDGWTLPDGPSLADEPNHPHRTDEACPKPDGPRYAAAGDGVTANVSEWIGTQLLALEANRVAA